MLHTRLACAQWSLYTLVVSDIRVTLWYDFQLPFDEAEPMDTEHDRKDQNNTADVFEPITHVCLGRK